MTTAYPLSWPAGWPRAQSRKRAKFSTGERVGDGTGYIRQRDVTIAEGTTRVLEQLERLNVQHGDAIISTNLELRLDGLPKSNQAEPRDPGVAVYWRPKGSQSTKVMAIDIYDRVADNLAAIAATLHAMRAIERHGGAQILERAFTGFTALPGQRDCWDVLGLRGKRKAGVCTMQDVDAAFRMLAKQHHPDRGGNADEFLAIQRAREQAEEALQNDHVR